VSKLVECIKIIVYCIRQTEIITLIISSENRPLNRCFNFIRNTIDYEICNPCDTPILTKIFKDFCLSSGKVAVKNYSSQIGDLKEFRPSSIFLTTKTFHLEQVLDNLRAVFEPGMKIVASQNGLGPEDLVADRIGRESALRMSLNYGVSFSVKNSLRRSRLAAAAA